MLSTHPKRTLPAFERTLILLFAKETLISSSSLMSNERGVLTNGDTAKTEQRWHQNLCLKDSQELPVITGIGLQKFEKPISKPLDGKSDELP